jgi:hypothetical protein
MITKNFGNGQMYIGFPRQWVSKAIRGKLDIPKDIQEWLKDKTYTYGYINGEETGIFLYEEDATAFKLRFGI